MDWVRWHGAYDDPASPLSQRLEVVRRRVEEALDLVDADRPSVLSLCAGDGRDLLPVLARRPARARGPVVVVEQDPTLAEAARLTAGDAGLHEVEVRQGDAASPAAWADALPVDVLLLCGIFGNITAEEVDGLVALAPALLRRGGCVVWTRGRTEPDLRPRVRAAFTHAGFDELAYDGDPAQYGVGLARLVVAPPDPRPPLPERLFAFLR
ncbi:hypothetical protein PO878_03750 [Iamia majanohamensis]|uniref:SAM-dependent methyltransferase n=1 Tax=Iamia majanohamensis TaxID=467976 RepID=A0AAF0BUH6_9ACTN|nr:hypothetical protein [Iamia majanohamensis]WCO67837.1 hypothetical protein PO878_03750 [Iamia majanohamensis]